jgi:Domain of unknown function (DUF4412)
MKNLINILILLAMLTSCASNKNLFVGKIVYEYSFTDLKGNDISGKIAPLLGREQHYFIDNRNYKAYGEKGNWVQLYNSGTNNYFHFNKDGKTAKKLDASIATSKKNIVSKLEQKEKIAGYECNAIQVDTDNATIVYYYNKSIKTNGRAFSKHNFGGWNEYLKATRGALSLKFVMTDHKNGFVWTSTAVEVSKQNLSTKDFEFPAGIKLEN